MDDCIFCKIIEGKIPAYTVYEDDNVLAFLDISQTTKGHTLLVPKKHVKNVYELDEETTQNVFGVVPKIANAIKQTFHPIGMNIVNNADKPLQSVFHFHIHFIPRYTNDDLTLSMVNHQDDYTKETYLKIANAIKNMLQK